MHPHTAPTRRDLAKWLAAAFAGPAAFAQAPSGERLSLSNPFLTANWNLAEGHLHATTLSFHPNGRRIALPADAFSLRLDGGRILRFSALDLVANPTTTRTIGDPKAIRRADRLSRSELTATARDPETGALLRWRALLLDRSRYLRQELSVVAGAHDLPVRDVAAWDFDLDNARMEGAVKGSPVVSGPMFLAFEHPLSLTSVEGSHVRCSLPRELPIRAGSTVVYSSVIGFAEEGQLRRGFLEYVEDQRAHPYRTFLHYNNWYDLGYFGQYNEASVLDRMREFGSELTSKRGATLDSFLMDDGWDDPKSLWNFHSGFPDGFANVALAARSLRAGVGVWLSPWGGYGKPKEERVRFGREQGFEIEEGGFALSGPKYYQRFRDVCRRMIAEYDVNQFKFDGTGNANRVSAGSRFDSDFDAALSLIEDLRQAKPDLYVNLTTGTYPSPFWLRFADSIWRGGEDHDFAGVGSWRQRWITYRDAATYEHVVRAGPLFPLNSLMLHGIIYGDKAAHLSTDPEGGFRAEVRSYFGTGTQLQELYLSPHLLSAENWDDLAEATIWSRANAATLVDTHWVGGDPAKLEAYGWAAWSPANGILTLRNPADRPQAFVADIERLFELSPGAPRQYRATSPWKSDRAKEPLALQGGSPREFQLAPFEVLNLNLLPV